MCWRSLTAHRLLGWILQALAFGSLQPSRAETYRDSRGALDDYRFTSGLKMYENTNCFNHRGGFRVSDDTNPVQHRTPQECKRLCLDHRDCEGFEVVTRHLSAGHPPEGPCWLRKHLDVRDCWIGEHGQGWSLFVVAGRYGGGPGGGGVLGDGEYVVVRDGRAGTKGKKKKKKKAPPPKALTVSGLTGSARWGNGGYKRLGKACGGGVYWQKRGDDAYVYMPRGRETWYLGDRLCSTVDYWSRCRGNATDVARCAWESREGKGYGEKIKVKAGKDKKKRWYMNPVIHDDYGPPLILVLVLAALLLCTCCALVALALRPRGQRSGRAVVVVEEKPPYEAQPEHDTEVLVIEQKDERACGGCW